MKVSISKLGVFLMVATAFTWSLDSEARKRRKGGFKATVTGFQHVSLEGEESPLGIGAFLGERLDKFGDVGLFGNYIPSDDGLEDYSAVGLKIAPNLIESDWGDLLWSNKVGIGFYNSAGQIVLGTGLTLEPGSIFHLTVEVLHQVEVKANHEMFPTTFGLGIGFHLY